MARVGCFGGASGQSCHATRHLDAPLWKTGMATSRPRTVRPTCEALEDRRLPAASLAVLSAADYRPDQILVQFKPGAVPQAEAGTTLGSSLTLVPGLYEIDLIGQTTV